MEAEQAIEALAALAQEHRLAVFRLLVGEGPNGLPAGEIADRVAVPSSTLSRHLAHLEQAHLLRSWRVSRQIYYAVDFEGTRELIAFLTEECCQGRPEICGYEGADNCCDEGDQPHTPVVAGNRREARNMTDKLLNVLFLCTGNSARSIMAECILNRLGQGRFRAFSAGSHPAGKVKPQAIDLLNRLHYPTDNLRSKAWDEFAQPGAPEFDFVITVCDNAAGEACPVWPGQPMTIHWSIPDPAAVIGRDTVISAAFADAYRMLERRIGVFVTVSSTPFDRPNLKKQLEEIGKTEDAATPSIKEGRL
jgi:ArsR family transcriptional regulator, arsenate/arsenite/antimonite-responsive transcriptional repressor / arsenate reductase (thioredoxin)